MAAPNGLIVGWPSTEGSIPAGWTHYTDLNSRLPKPAPASWPLPGVRNGGNVEHYHTYGHYHSDYHYHQSDMSGTTADNTTVDAGSGLFYYAAGSTHQHGLAGGVAIGIATGSDYTPSNYSNNIDAINHYTVIWIKSNGTTDIPVNAIAWNSRSAGVPTNWAACDGTGGHPDLVNYFLVGADGEGGSGGTRTPAVSHTHSISHSHTHSGQSHRHEVAVGTASANFDIAQGGFGTVSNEGGHPTSPSPTYTGYVSHTADSLTTDATTSPGATNEIPFSGLQHVQATSAVAAPRGLVALWDQQTLPDGWFHCDGSKANRPLLAGTGRFIRGSNLANIGEYSTTDSGHQHNYSHDHETAAGGGTVHSLSALGAQSGHSGTRSYSRNSPSPNVSNPSHGHTFPSDTLGRVAGFSVPAVTLYLSTFGESATPQYNYLYFIVYTGDKEIAALTATATAVGVSPSDIDTVFSARILPPTAAALADAPVPVFTPLAVWQPAVVVPPTAEAIAEALSGTRGAVSMRYRFEERTMLYEFVADITDAITKASVNLDNNRAVSRTASMTIRPDRLPASFNVETSHIAVNSQLLVGDVWVSWALGLFIIDKISETVTPNGNILWKANMADIGAHLFESFTSTSYTLPAGTNYISEVERILSTFGMRFIIEPWPAVTPASFTWKANTAWGTIANDLLDAINFYPLYSDDVGIIRTKFRRDPWREIPSIHYSTLAEPRMLRPELNRAKERGRYLNRVMVAISDSRFEPLTIEITNDDEDCPISTVYKGVTSAKVTADRCPDDTAMIELGAYELRDAAIKALTGDIITHPDPRRTNHEFYTLTIEDEEAATHWRCEGWKLDCEPGKTMQHEVGRADRVDVTLTAYLLGDQGAQDPEPEEEPDPRPPLPPPTKEPEYHRELDAPPP